MKERFDITDYPEVVRAINDILTRNKTTAEVKIERGGTEIVVVEQRRELKARNKVNQGQDEA